MLKNNEYTAYKLTTEVTKENDEWSLIGTLNKEFVSELINLNVDSEAEELGIWQEKFLDESGNWQMSSDITYSVEKPELGLENEDWVKIGQEYMAVINTNYNTLHLYASEDEDSMIITDPVFSNSISLLDKMKLRDLGELSKIGNIVEVKLDSTLSNNKTDNEVLSKNETTIESHEYNIDGVQRVINVDDKGNSEESFITGNVDGLTDVVIDLEDGSVSYSQDDDGRSK